MQYEHEPMTEQSLLFKVCTSSYRGSENGRFENPAGKSERQLKRKPTPGIS